MHGQEAALKLMGAQNCSMSARDRAATERELSLMGSLHHPCIVQVGYCTSHDFEIFISLVAPAISDPASAEDSCR